MAANRVTQMIDPWPPASGRRNIAYNGEKMQTAAERYRTGRIIPPVNATTNTVVAPQRPGASASDTGLGGHQALSAQRRKTSAGL